MSRYDRSVVLCQSLRTRRWQLSRAHLQVSWRLRGGLVAVEAVAVNVAHRVWFSSAGF